jgi:hypothetical protein
MVLPTFATSGSLWNRPVDSALGFSIRAGDVMRAMLVFMCKFDAEIRGRKVAIWTIDVGGASFGSQLNSSCGQVLDCGGLLLSRDLWLLNQS